jgi:RimJ/RimL family protein N-acetyltransferase
VLETGFHLRPQFWGQGYASEMARVVINHAFGAGLCSALFAGHHPHNGASGRVLHKLGFQPDGAEFYEPTGLMHPAYLLPAEEWAAPQFHLESERLSFGWWTPEREPLAQQLWGDPDVTHYIGGPHTPQQVRERFDNQFAYRRQCGQQYWPLFLLGGAAGLAANGPDRPTDLADRPAGGPTEFVGVCGLRPAPEDRYPDSPDILEMGFHLRPAFWRQGYGEEAARRVMAHAFDTLGVRALYSYRHPENAASGSLILKLGFTPDGEQYVSPAGEVIANAFLLTADTWRRHQ